MGAHGATRSGMAAGPTPKGAAGNQSGDESTTVARCASPARALAGLRARALVAYSSELAFYERHHTHRLNRLLHAVCVPLEWLAFLLLLSLLPPAGLGTTAVAAVACAAALCHLVLATPVALVAAAAHVLMAVAALGLRNACAASSNPRGGLAAAVLIEAAAWSVQVVVGHRLLEGNAPGMTKSLTVNSVVLSVMMAWDGCL